MFVPLADRMIRPAGRLALVLPKTTLTGAQWDRTRHLLADAYHVEYVIASHETDHWNFSDSTNLAEVLLLARKWRLGEVRDGAVTKWVQLSSNPQTAIDALGVVTALRSVPDSDLAHEVAIGTGLFSAVGEVFSRPAPTDGGPWPQAVFFKEALLRAAESLVKSGELVLPRTASRIAIKLRRLEDMGQIGYDRRDVTDAFELVSTSSGYPALWGTDAKQVVALHHASNAELGPRATPAKNRARIKPAAPVWAGAGRLLLAERLWLTTMRCSAIVVDQRCLSNTWWTINLTSGNPDDDQLLALWLNSTLGLLLWIYAAEETRGPWLAVKKNKLVELPVLEISALDTAARRRLLDCWRIVKDLELSPIAQLAQDATRALIDEAFVEALTIPRDALDALGTMFSAEPRLQPRVVPSAPSAQPPVYEELPLFG